MELLFYSRILAIKKTLALAKDTLEFRQKYEAYSSLEGMDVSSPDLKLVRENVNQLKDKVLTKADIDQLINLLFKLNGTPNLTLGMSSFGSLLQSPPNDQLVPYAIERLRTVFAADKDLVTLLFFQNLTEYYGYHGIASHPADFGDPVVYAWKWLQDNRENMIYVPALALISTHQSLPVDVLRTMWREAVAGYASIPMGGPQALKRILLYGTEYPDGILEIRGYFRNTLEHIASNPNVTDEMMQKILQFDQLMLEFFALPNPKFPITQMRNVYAREILEKNLIFKWNSLGQLIKNPALPTDMLSSIYQEAVRDAGKPHGPTPYILLNILRHPRTPSDILKSILNYLKQNHPREWAYSLNAAIENKNFPKDLLPDLKEILESEAFKKAYSKPEKEKKKFAEELVDKFPK